MGDSGPEDQRWKDLLVDPREEVHREIKSWLDLSDNGDCANLAKAMLALANSDGGQILIGYQEVGESWEPESTRPFSNDHYEQDTVNGIVEKFADPQFHCDVFHVEHPESGDLFPIIDVPGGHTVPIRAQRGGPNGRHVTHNEYYIRRPGPESAPPKTGREWDELIRRCVSASKNDLLNRMRTVLTGFEQGPTAEETDPIEKLTSWTDNVLEEWQEKVEDEYDSIEGSLYQHGYWVFSYSIEGDFETLSLSDFLELLREVKGHETGWPAWLISEDHVYPHGDLIESWLIGNTFNDPAHADFWRASPEGNMFLLRGYQEDSQDDYEAGDVFDVILPIWRGVSACFMRNG